ncbi:oxaloacetate decarboxylase subunit gamma [Salinivibrio sp. ES.052]|uniref:oxaloacetate decarboxylase subunit gamma n=1 Tax=Salinivibrio sp. ES.052 TaxID=1882823 RepID=UPI0009261466|nr:oxaloacetate decarboxylase subunit gamma [Salinivibrio sp. ES.052]SIO02577.1 oxaloacetate decarboxylase, gamma subunit [Salinivibrio sp. ES.052]
MDLGPLLEQALMLMLTGMAVVFVFLSILIFLVRQLERFGDPTPPTATKAIPQPKAQSASDTLSPDVVAAITVAVQQYRQRHR